MLWSPNLHISMNPPVPDAILDGEEDDDKIVDPADEHGDVRELDLPILILLENILWFKKKYFVHLLFFISSVDYIILFNPYSSLFPASLPRVETIIVALNRTAFITYLVRLINIINTFISSLLPVIRPE